MSRTISLLFPLVLLAVTSALAGSVFVRYQDYIFDYTCAQYRDCLQEFALIKKLSTNTAEIIAELERTTDEVTELNPEESRKLRPEIINLMKSLQRCENAVFSACSAKKNQFDSLLDKKLVFVSSGETVEGPRQPLFNWDDKNKSKAKKSLLLKLCANTIDEQVIEKLHSIYFLNSRNPDDAFIQTIPPSSQNDIKKALATGEGLYYCNATASYKAMFLFGSAMESLVSSQGGSYTSLDLDIVHEFVHASAFNDPVFKRQTDEFVNIRFRALKKLSDKKQAELKTILDKEVRLIMDNQALSPIDKTKLLDKNFNLILGSYYEWATKNKVPAENGPSTGRVRTYPSFGGYATFSDTPYFEADTSGKYSIWNDRNIYGMKDRDEYLAVALSMYRYDRKNAEASYSPEELQWLKQHWEYGYMTSSP